MTPARTAPYIPPAEILARGIAVDPKVSAFVRANAGSGKTTILVRRIIRLLLEGVEAEQILALTYTKAAAAEMQSRVFGELGDWVSISDRELDARIAKMEGKPLDSSGRRAARRLFAKALETPGGLKIQTIHAFCESLLHLFPFEANVPARFRVLDDLERAQLMRLALDGAVNDAMLSPHSLLGQALDRLTGATGTQGLTDWLRQALGSHREAVISTAGSIRETPDHCAPLLRLALGVDRADSTRWLDAEIVGKGIPEKLWPEISQGFRTGKSTDIKIADGLLAAAAMTDLTAKAHTYASLFLKESKEAIQDVGTKFVDPALKQRMALEKERIADCIRRRAIIERVERTESLFLLADQVRQRFETEKGSRGVLDFDDMIRKTETLFDRAEAQWVLYKLDSRISHLLIDEAQDTAPRQWSILRKLTGDFFAGFGQRGLNRTVFAVGDEKQSIFSFQGASPEGFGEAESHYRKRVDEAELEFKSLRMRLSFRTTLDILEAVDAAFAEAADSRGLSSDGEAPSHETARVDEPGFVEIWPALDPPVKLHRDPLDEVDATPTNAPPLVLAQRIAKHIALWIRDRHRFDNDGARIRPGDVMILVRKRGPGFDALIRELKREGVPVAGADRLRLTDHIAIEDFFVLADAVLNRENDLALATLLKSPLIGLGDDDLIALTADSAPQSLADRLDASTDPAHQKAAATLDEWRALARTQDPFGFFATILSCGHGRRAMFARLGLDAAEAIDVFLADVMDWQRRNPPSLAAFTASMRSAEREVKREMNEPGNAVRVMTVHAAKGLESRIVILADTFSSPSSGQLPDIVELRPARGTAPPIACLNSGAKPVPQLLADLRDDLLAKEEAEYRRLLYVAMTRAKDRLYITGYAGAKSTPNAWYRQIERRLVNHPNTRPVPADDGNGEVWRFRSVKQVAGLTAPDESRSGKSHILPAWWDKPVSGASPALPPLRPSNLQDAAEILPRRTASGNDAALQRGTLIHALLERLPALPARARQRGGQAFLTGRGVAPDEAKPLLESAMAVLEQPDFAFLFGPKSRAEAAVAGRLRIGGSMRDISGRIDRLAVNENRVILVDYKTGRPQAVPGDNLMLQLACYRALLMEIYPGRPVEAGILWTSLPRLDLFSGAELDARLAAIAQD